MDGKWVHSMAGVEPFPWETVIHAGLCLLRLTPKHFWALTPVEFFAMTGGLKPRGAALERAGLDTLMQAFPTSDRQHEEVSMDNNNDDFSGTLSGAQALTGVMADLEARSQRFGSALTGALRSATTGGRGLEDVLKGLGNRLTDIGLAAGLRPLENLLGNAVTGAIGGLVGSVTPFADGGVVRSPSFFPMGGDTGLMGEAGAEAILPLKRGADGSLGVSAGGGGSAPQIVFNVTASDAGSFRKSEGQISAMLARSVSRGRRGL